MAQEKSCTPYQENNEHYTHGGISDTSEWNRMELIIGHPIPHMPCIMYRAYIIDTIAARDFPFSDGLLFSWFSHTEPSRNTGMTMFFFPQPSTKAKHLVSWVNLEHVLYLKQLLHHTGLLSCTATTVLRFLFKTCTCRWPQ